MALVPEQESWLSDLLARCADNMNFLSEWEQGFVKDNQERYEKYGSEIRLSPKQIQILERVKDKLDKEEV